MEGNASSTKYEFIYFDLRGRGEAIRYLFADQGIDYKETLVPMEEWQAKWKPQMVFGQIPCLVDGAYDDSKIFQFNSILRYLGRRHGLYPDCPLEASQIDMITDHIEDIRKDYTDMIYKNYEEGKQPYIDNLPAKLKPLEKMLSDNNADKSGNCVGSKRSFLDYNMFDILDIHLVLSPSCLDKFPTLASFHKHMVNLPKMQEYRGTEQFKKRTINYGPNQ